MKKIILLYLFLFACAAFQFNLSAQEKVVERSAKKRPVWVSGVAQEYIITSAVSADLESAKSQALEEVRKQIIRAVAENVSLASKGTTQQRMENNQIDLFVDSFTSNYQTQSASIPYITGISFSNAEEFYWEKRQDKNTKAISVLYAIKYPLPDAELRKMIRAFEKQDQEMYGKYSQLEKQLTDIRSLEQIDRAILELNPLIAYFFDDVRKNAASSLQQQYTDLYKNVSIGVFSNKLGDHRFGLMLNGKTISTSQRMTVRSDDAYDINVAQSGDTIAVKYQFDGAEYGRLSEVTVNTKIGGKSVPHRFTFIVHRLKIKLYPEKTVYLTASTKNDSIAGQINIRIPIKSEYSSPYTIRSISLEVPGLSEPLFMDNLDITVNRKQETVNVYYDREIELLHQLNNRTDMVKGSIDVEIPDEQIDARIDFSLPVKTNW